MVLNSELCLQDIVERFHLVVALGFVLVEEMANNGRARPDAALLRTCAYFFSFEIVIGAGMLPWGLGFSAHRRLRGQPAIHGGWGFVMVAPHALGCAQCSGSHPQHCADGAYPPALQISRSMPCWASSTRSGRACTANS
jgi:hypothetical protein